ncbi:MAG: hypothetical protein JW709_13120 [Sedimentisphaerales bacterium]|nr:hypothetical protein [Sedimentisphaerales bacterium]
MEAGVEVGAGAEAAEAADEIQLERPVQEAVLLALPQPGKAHPILRYIGKVHHGLRGKTYPATRGKINADLFTEVQAKPTILAPVAVEILLTTITPHQSGVMMDGKPCFDAILTAIAQG